MSLTFANKITICRILAVPFFISFVLYYSPDYDHYRIIALGIFLFAMISDVIDGYIARAYCQKTKAGAVLDPLADKLLLISAFLCLYKMGVNFPSVRFPVWLIVAVISRDVVLLIGSMLIFIFRGFLILEATIWGKISTFFQALTILAMLLQWEHVSRVLWHIVIVFTSISGIDYIRLGMKIINESTIPLNKAR